MEPIGASENANVAEGMSFATLEAGELRTSLAELVTTAERLLEASRHFNRPE